MTKFKWVKEAGLNVTHNGIHTTTCGPTHSCTHWSLTGHSLVNVACGMHEAIVWKPCDPHSPTLYVVSESLYVRGF